MNRAILSFGAVSAIAAMFFSIHTFKGEDGQAMAAAGASVSGKTIAQDVRTSSSQKRGLRRALLDDQNGLLDMKGFEVRAVLDQPELVRSDLPTVVWQYRNEACVLDVYFTASSPKVSASPVVHYEVRSRLIDGDDEVAQNGCVRDMVRAKATRRFVGLDGFYKASN